VQERPEFRRRKLVDSCRLAGKLLRRQVVLVVEC
jgi:hypothetical protein